MGAYLSHPITDKESTDECNDYLDVGASSMQGWRNSQEDAHNSILDFDTNASLFAVYDGHGGAEVSTYCADKFPEFFKTLSNYKKGNYEQALKDAFLGFDKTLLQADVIDTLKLIAREKNQDDDSATVDDDDDEDLVELHEEGSLPLDEVLKKYKGHPSMPVIRQLKGTAALNAMKPQSPILRGRRAAAIVADAANRAVLDPNSKPEGSSTSKAAFAAQTQTLTLCAQLLAETRASHKLDIDAAVKKTREEGNLPPNNESDEAQAVDDDSLMALLTNIRSMSRARRDNESKLSLVDKKVISTAAENDEITNVTNGNDTIVDNETTTSNEQNGNIVSSTENTLSKDSDEKKAQATATNNEAKAFIINEATSTTANGKIPDDTNAITSTNKEDKVENELSKPKSVNDGETSTDSRGEGGKDLVEDDEDENEDNDDENENENDDNNVGRIIAFDMSDSDDSEDVGYYQEDDDIDPDDDDDDDDDAFETNQKFCANMIEEPGKDSGCTAVVSLLVGRDLYVANAGDSRCVVCRNGHAIEMSLDHKPEDKEETARIEKAGGRVTLDGRVNGGLNLSRALGDHGYKLNADLPAEEQMISALPDVRKLIITPEDEFMVLACDGIWNFMTSTEVVNFVRLRLEENMKMSQICEELFDACLAPNTMGDGTGCDNMTAVIVRFKKSIQQLESSLRPEETEKLIIPMDKEVEKGSNVVLANDTSKASEQQQQQQQTRAEKRAASPDSKGERASDGEKGSVKRMKCSATDKEGDDHLKDIKEVTPFKPTGSKDTEEPSAKGNKPVTAPIIST